MAPSLCPWLGFFRGAGADPEANSTVTPGRIFQAVNSSSLPDCNAAELLVRCGLPVSGEVNRPGTYTTLRVEVQTDGRGG